MDSFTPNVTLWVGVMADGKLHQASKEFVVAKKLKISLSTDKEEYLPGEEVTVRFETRDQNDKLIPAELSLALVDEALFARFPERLPPIRDFFYKQRRAGRFAAASSIAFSYKGKTTEVIQAILTELDRKQLEAARKADHSARASVLNSIAASDKAGRVSSLIVSGPVAALATPAEMEEMAKRERGSGYGGGYSLLTEGVDANAPAVVTNGRAPGRYVRGRGPSDGMAMWDADHSIVAGELAWFAAVGPGSELVSLREYFPETGYWKAHVLTDRKGKGEVTFKLPDTTTSWKLIARGVTEKTLVGEAKEVLITRKPFFVELKAPRALTEGDTPRLVVTVHNLTDEEQEVSLSFKASFADKSNTETRRIKVSANKSADVYFDSPEAAGEEMVYEIAARAGKFQDALKKSVMVVPWGIEQVASVSGVARLDLSHTLSLPKRPEYTHVSLNILVGPAFHADLLDAVLAPAPVRLSCRSNAASDLLATLYALDYLGGARATDETGRMLTDRAQSLASGLAAAQNNDGGWSFAGRGKASDREVSALTYWALVNANTQGMDFPPEVLDKAATYLEAQYGKAAPTDNLARALILHALSEAGKADYAFLNRLHRLRNSLDTLGLAYLALALVNEERSAMAGDIASLIEAKARTLEDRVYWTVSEKQSMLLGNVELSALAVLALEKAKPASPLIKKGIDWLLAQRAGRGWTTPKANAFAVAALSEYLTRTKPKAESFTLAVSVNQKQVRKVEFKGEAASESIEVPNKLIKARDNRIAFDLEGAGEYSYTCVLKGFDPSLKVDRTKPPYNLTRYYEPAAVEYQGKPIRRGFSVLSGSYSTYRNAVSNLPVGTVTQVSLTQSRYYYRGEDIQAGYYVIEEPIPAGCQVLEKSVQGNFESYQLGAGKIIFFVGRKTHSNIHYDLVGSVPGDFRVLPSKVYSLYQPQVLSYGEQAKLTVLDRGKPTPDKYRLTPDELYYLGKAEFDNDDLGNAGKHLEKLLASWQLRDQHYKEALRMMLYVAIAEDNDRKIVKYFEPLKERYPTLLIPFVDIVRVACRAGLQSHG